MSDWIGGRRRARANTVTEQADDELARALIRTRQHRGSLMILKASIVLLVLVVPFLLYVSVAVNTALGLALSSCALVFLGFQIGMLVLHSRGLHRPWFDWISATFEVGAVTTVIAIDAVYEGSGYAFTSAPGYLYSIAVIVSAVRLRRALSLYTGFVAGSSYAALYAHFSDAIDPALLAALPSLEAWNIIQRALFIAFSGVVAYLVCVLMRANTRELIASVRRSMQTEEVLGRHLSREVAALLVDADDRGTGKLADERDITVLFADVRRFTPFCERRAPAEVLAFLDQYFDAVTAAVERHGGIVNKFIGDGVLALFGAPRQMGDHAARAAAAARDIVAAARELGATWGEAEIDVGVGIHTGRAVVGIVGSEHRAEYTAVGDAVNVASRIEELTKTYKRPVLLSGAAATAVGDAIATERVAEVTVRGRAQPLVLYAIDVPARASDPPDRDPQAAVPDDTGAAEQTEHGRALER